MIEIQKGYISTFLNLLYTPAYYKINGIQILYKIYNVENICSYKYDRCGKIFS